MSDDVLCLNPTLPAAHTEEHTCTEMGGGVGGMSGITRLNSTCNTFCVVNTLDPKKSTISESLDIMNIACNEQKNNSHEIHYKLGGL